VTGRREASWLRDGTKKTRMRWPLLPRQLARSRSPAANRLVLEL